MHISINVNAHLQTYQHNVASGIKKTGQRISLYSRKVVAYVTALKNDSNSLVSLIRVSGYIFTGYNFARGRFTDPNRSNILTQSSDMIETAQIFSDIDYLLNRKYKNDGKWAIAGNVSLFFSDICGVFLWLNELTVIQLAKISNALGKVPVLKVLAKVTLINVVKCTYTAGYALLGFDAIYRLVHEKETIKKRQAALDLASCTAEVAFGIFLLSGGTSVPLYISFGIVAAGLGFAAFLHKFEFPDKK